MVKKSMVLIVKDSFSAAHKLSEEMGKCANLHGHTWHIQVGVKVTLPTPLWESSGITVDFKSLKEIIRHPIEMLDHQNLNNFLPKPSAEKLSAWFWEKIEYEILDQGWGQYLDLEFIEIWESEKYGVRIENSKKKGVKNVNKS